MVSAAALERTWAQVRELARSHPQGWDGEDLTGEDPLVVYTGPRPPRRLLVVSKHTPLLRWPLPQRPQDLAIVIASGRLGKEHVPLLRSLSSSRTAQVAYVGDADPLGLHTFLSLRVLLGARRVAFCGVSDALPGHLGLDEALGQRNVSIELTAFERAHLKVLLTLVSPVQVLGARVGGLLLRGRKLEIEGLSFRSANTPGLFAAALERAARSPRGAGAEALLAPASRRPRRATRRRRHPRTRA